MNIVIFGASGMLGFDLSSYLKSLPNHGYNIVWQIATPTRNEVDISDRINVQHYLTTMKAAGYDVVINCAAATDVNGIQSCVSEETNSYSINALAPKYIAEACKNLNMRLVHISTDYVYSDKSLNTSTYHDEFPANIYGYHKLIGELFVKNAMPSNYTIIRVGCLYGMHREKSFVHKFLKNAASSIRYKDYSPTVVNYQRSTPTSTMFVCDIILNVLKNGIYGTVTASPQGAANRFEFASKIIELANETGAFPDELKFVNVKKDFCELNYFIPSTSCMGSINQTSHIGYDFPWTWEDDLKRFIEDSSELLSNWFKELLKENEK